MTNLTSRRNVQIRWSKCAVVLGLLAPGFSLVETTADDHTVFSGPQVGEQLPPFSMRTVVGPQAGKEQDLITEAAGDPVLLVFVHERTRPAFGLANVLMQFAATRREAGLHRGLIFLTDDATATETWMKNISNYFEKQTPVGFSVDGPEGPGAYGLNRNVALTILVGTDAKTTANFALVQPSIQADGPKILQAIVDVTGGGKAPDIAKYLPQGMRARTRMQRQPEGDAKLQGLLRAVIQKDASEQSVQKAIKAVDDYIADKPKAKQELGQRARRVVDSGKLENYGIDLAQQKLKVWADKYGPAESEPQNDRSPRK
jgi:hypothetical protein